MGVRANTANLLIKAHGPGNRITGVYLLGNLDMLLHQRGVLEQTDDLAPEGDRALVKAGLLGIPNVRSDDFIKRQFGSCMTVPIGLRRAGTVAHGSSGGVCDLMCVLVGAKGELAPHGIGHIEDGRVDGVKSKGGLAGVSIPVAVGLSGGGHGVVYEALVYAETGKTWTEFSEREGPERPGHRNVCVGSVGDRSEGRGV